MYQVKNFTQFGLELFEYLKNANNKSGNIKFQSTVPILGVEPFVIYSENLAMINMNTSVRIEISTSVRHENSQAGT